jgi:hypothetical protein
MLVTVEEVTISMAKWKTKAYKKKSMRERQKVESTVDGFKFGRIPSGRERVAFDLAVDRFIRDSSCRHKQLLGNPCASFDATAEGKCKRDGLLCDLLTEKGERYWREYELVAAGMPLHPSKLSETCILIFP